MKAQREFSSGGVVLRRHGGSLRVLLIKDGYSRWTWPKGNIDAGETPREAASREIAEEVGIKSVKILERLGKTEYYYKLKGRLVFKTVYLYLCETRQKKLTIQTSEIETGRWLSPEEALKKVDYRGAKTLLRKALTRFASLNNITAALSVVLLLASASSADTVTLKDKTSIKGIVIENYVDRILYSTSNGEREILKSDIRDIEYHEPVDNLINLGDTAFEKRRYKAALKYYTMASEINPLIDALRRKILRTESIIYKLPEMRKMAHMDIKNEIMSGHYGSSAAAKPPPEAEVKGRLGLELKKRGNRFFINSLKPDSPFRKAGAAKGDAMISVWAKLCDYLSYDELCAMLLDPQEVMITVVIERNLKLPSGKPFDAALTMEWEGATINAQEKDSSAHKAGLKDGDLLTAINSETLRYTPLNIVQERLGRYTEDRIVTVQRKLDIIKIR
jgi:diadenosine hexaphosphate hydrolase (ATP-forming)